jgi:hypothetical protein
LRFCDTAGLVTLAIKFNSFNMKSWKLNNKKIIWCIQIYVYKYFLIKFIWHLFFVLFIFRFEFFYMLCWFSIISTFFFTFEEKKEYEIKLKNANEINFRRAYESAIKSIKNINKTKCSMYATLFTIWKKWSHFFYIPSRHNILKAENS